LIAKGIRLDAQDWLNRTALDMAKKEFKSWNDRKKRKEAKGKRLNSDQQKEWADHYRTLRIIEEERLRNRLRKFDLDVSSRIREKKNRDSIRSRARRFIYNRNNPEFMRKYREAHKRYQNQLRLRRINKALGIVSAQYLGDTKPMYEHGKKRKRR